MQGVACIGACPVLGAASAASSTTCSRMKYKKAAPLLPLPVSLRAPPLSGPAGAAPRHGEASTATSHLLRRRRLSLTARRELLDRTASSLIAEVHEPSSFSTQSLSQAEKIKELAGKYWCETFELNLRELGIPLGPITRQRSWAPYLGPPIKQGNGTCVLAAFVSALYADHRLQRERDGLLGEAVRLHGAHPKHPNEWLLDACQRAGIWAEGMGVLEVGKVPDMIQQMGGVPAVTTTNAPAKEFLLPLHSWEVHAGDEVTPERVATQMDSHGPCVGMLWMCPWYPYFDAEHDGGTLVYRGCGRSQAARDMSEELYVEDEVGRHAVVCYGYRFCGEEMHLLVLDNQHDTGPRRWVHVNELNALYTLHV